ncbi:cytochrome c-type biogenesis protein CcsB [Raineyella antarctica]|uniref:Cytochrome c-type biogenesis protein CcsB n=1 Tax=Raineyella antarctica TaxID=1577474 RepID=A0A1G6GES0_9ACTN|nr:cytochrome c-type biogenesis protein CcsB [Raineyella antarctica]
MDFAAYSNLAMMTAWLLYLVAMMVFGLEWAMARRVPDETVAETAEPALVGATVGAAEAAGTADGTSHRTVRTSVTVDPGRAPEGTDKWGRIALAITMVGWVANVVGTALRGVAAHRFPWGNMYEFTITTVMFIVAAFLVLAMRHRMRWLGLPVTLLATIGVGLAVEVFYVAVADLVPALHSWWFVVHIVAASIAGALFNIGSLLSILYLLRKGSDERGTTRGWLAQLPSTKKLDLWAYRTTAAGFPLWTFAVAAGAVWAQYAWGRFWGWDPKETFSLVTWVIVAAYLHARLTAGWKGSRAAILSIIVFVSFWFNFIGVNLVFSGLHSYAGV